MNNRKKEIVLAVLVFIAAILLALNTTRYFFRIDMTENKSFTISNTTKEYIRSIPEEVNITYYISDKIRTIAPAASQIEDLLFEYAANSRKHVVVNSLDPAKHNMEGYVKNLGVTAQQVEIYDRNERAYSTVYSGIIIQYLDKTEAIGFILDAANLEYEVTSRIQKLVEGKSMKIGLLSGHESNTVDFYYSFLQGDLSQNSEVQVFEWGQEIPSDISVLFVLGNKDISEGDLLPVDEYMMAGGKVIFCVDGVDVNMVDNLKATKLETNPCLEMLKKWGITVNNDLVLDRYCKKITLKGTLPLNYPQWLSINNKFVSKDNPVMAGFMGMDLLWASSIDIQPVEGLGYEQLMASTDDSWILTDYVSLSPFESYTTFNIASETKGSHPLGFMVSGKFHSAFTDKTSEDTKIIVVADADFLSNLIEYSESPSNLIFAENAVQYMSNDSFMGIKTRSMRDMRLNKISDIRTKIRAILMVYAVNIFIIPLGIIIYGVVRYFRRKRKDA